MIKRIIHENASKLNCPEGLDGEALLWAVYYCEHYDKHNRRPRFEAAYAPGGIYFSRSPQIRQGYAKWGSWACCSFSNFQIMYPTAVELGYSGPPLALDKDEVAIPYVIKYINTRCLARGAKTPEEVADCYNSGTHLDKIKPEKYIVSFRGYYDRELTLLKEERNALLQRGGEPASSDSSRTQGNELPKPKPDGS